MSDATCIALSCAARETRLAKFVLQCCAAICCLGVCCALHAGSALQQLAAIENSGLLLTDSEGKVILAQREHDLFIPASTAKLLTAWLALSHWGEDHRFSTDLYLDRETATLWIKGSGDPFLVSEELSLMAGQIQALAPGSIERIALDTSLFDTNLAVPGASTTSNPYDAIPTSLAANFNTLNLRRVDGKLRSAEAQTPLTPFAIAYARANGGPRTAKSLRINTGQRSQDSERYFVELLAQLLRQRGLQVGDAIVRGTAPVREADLRYTNTHTLGEVIQAMLKYSTNFIANQLMLTLAAEHFARAGNFRLVQQYMQQTLQTHFDWQNLSALEGAGLSTQNRISARQLIDLLQAFKPWQHLLPEVEAGIFAKTGTLTGVSTLAGVIHQHNRPPRYFALLINEPVPAQFSREIALELATQY